MIDVNSLTIVHHAVITWQSHPRTLIFMRCAAVLADIERPPDTSRLVACDERATACAVEHMRKRLLRRRRALNAENSKDIDGILAALRRLQNPQLGAYRAACRIVLSEPFNGLPSVVRRTSLTLARATVGSMLGARPPEKLLRALSSFGATALRAARAAGVTIAIVPDGVRFADRSPAIARAAPEADQWSSPPSGLFVVNERRLLLRERSLTMAAAHEFAHALDAILARRRGSYFSFECEELRYYFATAMALA